MKTNEAIKDLFLKKILSTPVESITVSSLSSELKIKRQTFYYYYRDIFDLVESILIDYKNDLLFNKSIQLNLVKIIDFCGKNIEFFNACVTSNLKDIFHDFIFDLLLKYSKEKVLTIAASNNLNNDDINEISSFFASGLSLFLENKLKDKDDFDSSRVVNKMDLLSSKEILNRVLMDYYENRKRI